MNKIDIKNKHVRFVSLTFCHSALSVGQSLYLYLTVSHPPHIPINLSIYRTPIFSPPSLSYTISDHAFLFCLSYLASTFRLSQYPLFLQPPFNIIKMNYLSFAAPVVSTPHHLNSSFSHISPPLILPSQSPLNVYKT